MRHSKAINIIERAFGIMKMRWGTLRSPSYYPIKVQNRLIVACFLLHNFICNEMEVDPFETAEEDYWGDNSEENGDQESAYIDCVASSDEWNKKRTDIAQAMWHHLL